MGAPTAAASTRTRTSGDFGRGGGGTRGEDRDGQQGGGGSGVHGGPPKTARILRRFGGAAGPCQNPRRIGTVHALRDPRERGGGDGGGARAAGARRRGAHHPRLGRARPLLLAPGAHVRLRRARRACGTPSPTTVASTSGCGSSGSSRRVASLDAAGHALVFEDGSRLAYDRLLLAVGSKGRPAPWPGAEGPGPALLRDAARPRGPRPRGEEGDEGGRPRRRPDRRRGGRGPARPRACTSPS